MHVTCDRSLLAAALRSISKITKQEVFPLYHAVLLTATIEEEQGTLTIVGIGMLGTFGLRIQVQARVDEEGDTLVPIEPLSSYIEVLQAENLTLIQEQIPSSPGVEPKQKQGPLAQTELRKTGTLLIESSYTRVEGTRSTNTAKLKAWPSEYYPLPPIQEWASTPLVRYTLSASLFKKAIASCASFARSDAWQNGNSAEMSGIHFRLEARSLTLSATTRTMLISHHLPLNEPATLALTSLFKGEALFWMRETLPSKGQITFALAKDPQTQKLILVLSTAGMTWFCQSMEISSPIHWEDLFQEAHEAEILVRRDKLRAPLKFFAKMADASEGVVLATKETVLRMNTIPGTDDPIEANQTLHLESSSRDIMILINPKQFQRLVRLVPGKVLRLEIGSFTKQGQQRNDPIGFLRASSEHIQVVMSLSHEEKQPEPAHSSDQSQESELAPIHL